MSELAPLPLRGVRVADLTWALASAGNSTLLASLGAEVIRIEWPERMDFTRLSETAGVGISSREVQRTPLGPGKQEVPYRKPGSNVPPLANRSGVFNDRNPGKYGITLNMARAEGREVFKRLVRVSDIVMDGFKAPVMGKWGLDYAGLCTVKRDIIYIQMSGYGNSGPCRDYGSLGPTAQAFSGLGYQHGLAEPHEPTSWSHSYMDTTPPFYGALAVIGALHYRNRTGRGQYIDQAQYAPGLFLSGTALLDFCANGRRTTRHGNRSPHLPAAPHGIYRCTGDDAWIAIAAFSEAEWRGLCGCMGHPAWTREARFASLEARLASQDSLDALVDEWTRGQERYELMYRLQAAGVPAGVVQSPEDKFRTDPQLKVRDFFVHLDHSELGTWPFTRHLTPKLSATPAHPGGPTHRGAPCIGEDNAYVYAQVLGMGADEIRALEAKGII
jgi:crotonobetainyl-CoA:carnitine CoA-transferase CaiB-like acyl-CoA transferase